MTFPVRPRLLMLLAYLCSCAPAPYYGPLRPARPQPDITLRIAAVSYAFRSGTLQSDAPPATLCLINAFPSDPWLEESSPVQVDSLKALVPGVDVFPYSLCEARGNGLRLPVFAVRVWTAEFSSSGYPEVRVDIENESFRPGTAKVSTSPGPPYYIIRFHQYLGAWRPVSIVQQGDPY